MTLPSAIRKLRNPPAVHNWVRSIRKRRDETALTLFDFAMHGPRHSLLPILDIIRQVVVDGIDDATAMRCLQAVKKPLVRSLGSEILKVALPHIRSKGWSGLEIFRNLVEYYRVAADVSVPVKPTFVTNENGKLTLYFVICWAKLSLTGYQKRIMSTLISEALLTLEEFERANVVILCIPRHKFSKSERFVLEWNMSDYPILTESEKGDLFERYGSALKDAERMVIEALG